MSQLTNHSTYTHTILTFLLLLLIAQSKINTVLLSNYNINALSNYTFDISFTGSSPFSTLTLLLPTQITILSNYTVSIGPTLLNSISSGSTITITSSLITPNITLVVSNIENPSSAIKTNAFSYANANQNHAVSMLVQIREVQYTGGTFSACPWSFTLCTEQPNSQLMVSITTVNKIPSGDNYVLINYASTWANLNTKSLTSSVNTFTCSYSINGAAFIIISTSSHCTNSGTTISVLINTVTSLTTGTSLIIKILGVNSPPTESTASSISYSISTADISKNTIDTRSSCPITNVCITNYTNSKVTSITSGFSSLVNGNFGSFQIVYLTNPITITFIQDDIAEVYFNPLTSLSNCNMTLYRSQSVRFNFTTSSTFITYRLPLSSSGTNNNFTAELASYFQCTTGFILPNSETPETLTIIFKRQSSEYLRLSTSITATASIFNAGNAKISATTNQMASSGTTYTFNFLTGQVLSNSPKITLQFPNDFTLTSPTCTAAILGSSTSNVLCSESNKLISLTLRSSTSTIPSNSNVTITVNGITNPLFPKAYTFQMTTFYNETVATSRVESNLNAFSYTIVGISNYPTSFEPTDMPVYKIITTIITLTNIMDLPTGSLFSVQFPIGTINVASSTTVLTVSGSSIPISTPIISGRIVTFTISSSISLNQVLKISLIITTPKTTGDYTFVVLTISHNSISYISSANTMYLKVNSTSVMLAEITSGNSITGANTIYTLDLTLSIPHDSTFFIQIQIPTGVSLISSGAQCSNCITTTISPIANNTYKFTANNSFPGIISKKISYNLQTFTNPRQVGLSSSFIITTKSIDDKLISNQSAQVNIINPNILTGVLLKTQEYYRYNVDHVKIALTFTNDYLTGDQLQILFTSSSYSPNGSIACANNFGTCSIKSSTSDTTTIKIILNETNIINKSITIFIQGLISSSTTLIGQSSTITLTTLSSSGRLIDRGQMIYNLSCSNVANNCKRCSSNGDCTDCYLNEGFYLSGKVCVTQCGPATSYLSYADNSTGKCSSCINNCYTCSNATYCTSCNLNFVLYTDSRTCQSLCAENSGYFKSGTFCFPCVTGCLACTSSGNSCTMCNNATFLQDGLCAANCGSVGVYNLNGRCYPCHVSCLSCTGEGEDKCNDCNINYFSYLSFCVSECPYGTGNNPISRNCSCHDSCITCSNYTTCLSCSNRDYFVYNGNCIDKCPDATYLSQGVCIPCSTGCSNCTINTCNNCSGNNKLYDNSCYSDCNLLSRQFDVDSSGLYCVLCPDGCDSCSGLLCTSCISQYTLDVSKCTKTCLLTDSCNIIPSTPLPLPGLLTFAVWLGIVIIVKLLMKQNYVPYSLILFSGVIQLVLTFALISSINSSLSQKRLLATDISSQRSTMIILLAIAIAFNYIFNFIFVGIFVKYFKPLIPVPRQIDIISYVAMLIISTCTNFRFSFVAFARMFPKPYIYIQNPSKLTPLHYLCLSSVLFDIMLVVACGIAIFNETSLTNTYMLAIDLLVIIIINIALTIWFLASQKPNEYYKESIVKYQIQDNIKNHTNETLPNEKEASKHNIANESLDFVEDLDQSLNNTHHQYAKLTQSKTFKVKGSKMTFHQDENISQIKKASKIHEKMQPGDTYVKNPNEFYISDINYQQIIPSKIIQRSKISINAYQDYQGKDMNKSISSSDKMHEDNLSLKNRSKLNSFGKVAVNYEGTGRRIQKSIEQIQENDNETPSPNRNKKQLFDTKEKISRPKKVNSERKDPNKMMKSTSINKKEEPARIMKKNNNVGVFQTDAFSSNTDAEDIEAIIKNKIWQSQNKFSTEKLQMNGQTNEQTPYEQISPSWFNIQNQRLDIQQFEQSSQS